MLNYGWSASVGQKMRTLREHAGYSQGEVAKWIGVHRPTITMIENGKQRLTLDMFVDLCHCYGKQPEGVLAWLCLEKR